MWQRFALVFAIVLLAAASAQPLQARPESSDRAQLATAFLQWTRNGVPIGDPQPAPENANVFRAFWPLKKHGGATLQWTVDGQPAGSPNNALRQATDVELRWDPSTGRFTNAWWARNCVRFKKIPVAEGANDVHVRLTKRRSVFIRAFWSLDDDQPLPPEISVPPGANDFEIVLAPAGSSSENLADAAAIAAC